jgi:hypothetical protein
MDVYFGGYASVTTADGKEIKSPTKVYQHVKDIPGYNESTTEFPTLNSVLNVNFTIVDQIQPYELLVLDDLAINVLVR